MSVKIFDTMTTATPNFPLAYAEKINVKLQDGTEDNLQNLFDNGELIGGGGDSSVTLTQQEYEALSEEQKLGGLYYTYDTKRIYKNGVQYGASDAEGIGYNNAESGIQATTVQGAIDKVNDSLVDIESALGELENITKLTDFDEAIPEKGKNKIYYVNKIIGTYKCAQWRVESMYYDVSGLEQYRGVQKATSLNGVDNIMLMREYYLGDNNVMRWTDWQELATMDKITQPIGFKTSLLNQCWGYYTKSGKTISVHMKFVLSNALSDWQHINNTKLPTPSSELTKSANGKTGATNSVYIYADGTMSQAGGGGMPAGIYEFDFDYTTV